MRRKVFWIIAVVALAFHPVGVLSEGSVTVSKSPEANTVAFGPVQHFSRHLKRREASTGATIETVPLTIAKVLSSDRRLVRIDNLSIQYAVVDRTKFANSFGRGESSKRRAQFRLKTMVEVELRFAIAQLSSNKLRDLDPLSVLPPHATRLAAPLQKLGIVILELTTERSGFRLSSPPD